MPRSRAHTCCTPTTSPTGPPTDAGSALYFPVLPDVSPAFNRLGSGLGVSLPANAGDRWGFDVAATGDTYVIGGPGNDAAGADAGEVRIGSFSNPGFVEVLSPDPSFDPARLGTAVVVDGDRMVASAPFASAGASGAGLVYVYERANASAPWALTTSISSPDPEFQGGFGDALDLRGPLLAIGESDRFGDGAEPGRVWVYAFTGSSWELQGPPLAPAIDGAENGDQFGASLAWVDETVLAIGAPGAAGSTGRVALVFDSVDAWDITEVTAPSESLRHPATSSDSTSPTGRGVLSGSNLFVGAPGRDDAGLDGGAVYRFGVVEGEATWTNSFGYAEGGRVGTSVDTSGDRAVAAGYGGGTLDGADPRVRPESGSRLDPDRPFVWNSDGGVSVAWGSSRRTDRSTTTSRSTGPPSLSDGPAAAGVLRSSGVGASGWPTVPGNRDRAGRSTARRPNRPCDRDRWPDTRRRGPRRRRAVRGVPRQRRRLQLPPAGDGDLRQPHPVRFLERPGELGRRCGARCRRRRDRPVRHVPRTTETGSAPTIDTLSVAGQLRLRGDLTVETSSTIATFATVDLQPTATFDPSGDVTLDGLLNNAGPVVIDGPGSITGSGRFVNDDVLRKTGSGTLTIGPDVVWTSRFYSEVDVAGGSVEILGALFDDNGPVNDVVTAGTFRVAAGTTLVFDENLIVGPGTRFVTEIAGPSSSTGNYGRIVVGNALGFDQTVPNPGPGKVGLRGRPRRLRRRRVRQVSPSSPAPTVQRIRRVTPTASNSTTSLSTASRPSRHERRSTCASSPTRSSRTTRASGSEPTWRSTATGRWRRVPARSTSSGVMSARATGRSCSRSRTPASPASGGRWRSTEISSQPSARSGASTSSCTDGPTRRAHSLRPSCSDSARRCRSLATWRSATASCSSRTPHRTGC